MAGDLVDACARILDQAATDPVGEVADKIVALHPLLSDLDLGAQLACAGMLTDAVQVLERRQAE